ncbi:MAG: phosphomannomutase/phosphoglucomutase [Pseudomonadota bacterium]
MSTATKNYRDPEHVSANLFKAYDIRGIVGANLFADTAYAIGRAFGSESLAHGHRSVVIGRDGRLSGPEMTQALAQGLMASGADVIDVGAVPTGVLYYAAQVLTTGSGIQVTGSHNPPDYNGFKMVVGGDTLSGERIQDLRVRIENKNYASGRGQRTHRDILPDYMTRVLADVRLAKPLHVVVDCGNGIAGKVAPDLLKALGCRVKEMYCEVDGRFPNHHPDPSQPETLQALIKMVRGLKADIGLAFDGDGDRLGVIAPGGEIIWADRQMILYAEDVLSRNPGSEIIYDIKCSRNLGQRIASLGGKPLMWRTGHSLIKAKLKESGAPLAGEMSGHIFFKDRWYGFDDALYCAARLLEILARDTRSTGEIFSALPDMINTPELRLDLEEGTHFTLMQQLLDAAVMDEARLTTIDGLRADFVDGWGLVRASNTTPCLVIRFEAENAQAMQRIQACFRDMFYAVDKALKLPF